MVYCNYKSDTDDIATYVYGQTIGDITGKLMFRFGDEEGIENWTHWDQTQIWSLLREI